MKTHSLTKLGLGGAIIVGATILPHMDDLNANLGKAVNGLKETACVVQGGTNDMLNVVQNCDDLTTGATVKPTGPAADSTGDHG